MSVLPGACNVDSGPSVELSIHVSLDDDANRGELLLALLFGFVEVLFVVLGQLDKGQLAGTGAKEITFSIKKNLVGKRLFKLVHL